MQYAILDASGGAKMANQSAPGGVKQHSGGVKQHSGGVKHFLRGVNKNLGGGHQPNHPPPPESLPMLSHAHKVYL